jgi:hypothetical protein
VSRRDEAANKARRERNDLLAFEAVWCVCDVDQHATLAAAREMAAKEAVGMAVSNPCFELWCLLHFDD